MALFILGLASAALFYAVFASGGVERTDWNVSLVLLGSGALLYVVSRRRSEFAPRLDPILLWSLILLPAYLLFQLTPFPLTLLRLISPARAELSEALRNAFPSGGFAALSVVPAATLESLLRICAYIAAFILMRELAWHMGHRRWAAALPLVSVAAFEAVLGLFQLRAGNFAHGTYVNRNHFAGLLEMALPFPLMYAVSLLMRSRQKPLSVKRAFAGCAGFSVAALILAAVLESLSRMGFLACLAALFTAGALSVPIRRRPVLIGMVALATLALLVLLPPDALIERMSNLGAPGEISSGVRVQIWRDTLALFRAFPLFGCGVGAYQSALLRYKTAAPLNTVDYAHNDYLQLLAELGIVGCVILTAVIFGLLRTMLRNWRASPDAGARNLNIACLSGMVALLLHSATDFNLYIPANALALAWICGIAGRAETAAPQSGRLWKSLRVAPVIEAEASK
jgi:O-antigen ligase